MDKILELGDVFSLNVNNWNWTFFIPIVIVIGAIAVFMFGFKKPESPKFHRSVVASGNSNSLKRKKRNVNATVTVGLAALGQSTNKTLNKSAVATGSLRVNQSAMSSSSGSVVVPPSKDASSVTPTKKTSIAFEKKQQVANKQQSSAAAKSKSVAVVKGGNSKQKKIITATNVNKSNTSFVDNGENGGEWQTVITKKQKKQTADILIQAVAEVAASAASKTSKTALVIAAAKQSTGKTITKSPPTLDNNTTNVDILLSTTAEQGSTIEEIDCKNEANKVPKLPGEPTSSVQITTALNMPEAIVSMPVNGEAEVTSTSANVVFDELGDWTESKAQKRNKKRALKEH